MRPASKEFEASVGGVADADEILVLFPQVHCVVSETIGSRFWQLQEGDSSDDKDTILAEVAVESKTVNQSINPTDEVSISCNGAQSPIRSILQVGGKGDYGQGSSSKTSKDQLFGDAIAVGYSLVELRKVGILSSRSVQRAGAGWPWQGHVPPPRLLPPVTVGDAIDRARRHNPFQSVCHGNRAIVRPEFLPVQNAAVRLDSLPVQNSQAL